jgi:hypothetical protein
VRSLLKEASDAVTVTESKEKPTAKLDQDTKKIAIVFHFFAISVAFANPSLFCPALISYFQQGRHSSAAHFGRKVLKC